jgi:Protein of unknown function (DUF3443)
MRHPVRKIIVFALSQLLFLAACGGGSTLGGAGSSSGGGGSSQTIATVNNTNVVSMEVDAGPTGSTGEVNIPYVSVTICAPGSTTNCQTIDHMEVDTGSYGVRIISSVLNSTMLAALTPETASVGGVLTECTMFGDGYSWGSMRLADVKLGTEKASSQSVQIIGDEDSLNNVPSACSGSIPNQEDTVAVFGANGIIGVGPFVTDCGDCTASIESAFYWGCPSGGGSCTQTLVTTAQEASNPVAAFTTDNNGVILELPALTAAGATTATGALVFGVGTESNNALGSATVLTTDSAGFINTVYKNTTFTQGFIDSGSNLNFFNDNSITACTANSTEYYCPSSELTETATEQGITSSGGIGNQVSVTFYVTNLASLSASYAAFDNVAAPFSSTTDSIDFDFGLPFFYGRNVFTVIEGASTPGGMGPYFAF